MRRPLVYCFLAFAASLIASRYLAGSYFLYGGLFFLLLLSLPLLRHFKAPLCLYLLLPIFILGFYYGESQTEVEPEYEWQSDVNYELSGVVTSFPEAGETSVALDLVTSAINGEAVKVKARLLAEPDASVAYGDVLQVTATAMPAVQTRNPGNFDYASYQRDNGISATLSALYGGSVQVVAQDQGNFIMYLGNALRSRFMAALDYLPDQQGDIIAGIFLGSTDSLSQETLDTLSQTGIRHCFCVSGLHVGFVVLFVHLLLTAFTRSRRLILLFLAPALLLYCAVTGFYPAVCRASIMCFLVYAAMALGRPGDGFSALALAGFILLLWQPSNLWLVGFQLSFTAMFSILYFLPFFQHLVKPDFFGKSSLLVTLAAQVLMLPLIAYYFQTVSLISLFINSLCCFLVGGIVVLSLGSLILAVFSPFLGAAPLVVAGLIAEAVITGAELLTHLPWAYYYRGAFPLWALGLAYLFLLVIPRLNFLYFRPLVATAAVLLVLGGILFPWTLAAPNSQLQMTFLSVGQGNCFYISTPEGQNILVDAGGKESQATAINTIRPYLLHQGVNKLDYIFISHADYDHVASLPYLLDFFKVKQVVFTQAGYYYSSDYETQAYTAGAEVVTVETGDNFTIGGVDFQVLYPDKELVGESNDLSMVLKVSYHQFAALLTGDIGAEAIESLLAQEADLKADVLCIPHHGSKSSYSEEFYQAVAPTAGVISVGRNSYGHPYYKIHNYFLAHDIPLYRTDLNGAVTISQPDDGAAFTVETFN